MNDPSYNIQTAVFSALSGITWEGQEILVYDEMAAPDAIFPRILLLDVTGGGARDSKCSFGGEWTQTIKVSNSFPGRVTKKGISAICNEILNRLVPLHGPWLDIGAPFNIWFVEGNSLPSQSYTDGIRQYIDKNIRITYYLTEQ